MSYFQGVMQTNIGVIDIQKTKEWYTNVLGLKVEKDYDTTVVLSFGEDSALGKICLIEDKDPSDGAHSMYPVLQISQEYKDILYKKLREKGVKVEENPSHSGHFKFFDCEGNKLEAYCPGIYEKTRV